MSDLFGHLLELQAEDLDNDIMHYVERDDNLIVGMSTKRYFLEYHEWSPAEQELVDRATGKILDLGCGAGRHAIYLQNKKLDVIGLDISPKTLQVSSNRGVHQTIQGSILHLNKISNNNEFDTLLTMGNNFPLCHSEELMLSFLQSSYNITNSTGKILMHFLTATPTQDPIHIKYQHQNLKKKKRKGDVKFRLRYLNLIDDWIDFYLPTPEEFFNIIDQSLWKISFENQISNNWYIELIKK